MLLLAFFVMLFVICTPCAGEEQCGFVAKVTTQKGPLKMRTRARNKARVLDEIPNGTCVLVTEEGATWCQVDYRGQSGYCRTEYLTFLRGSDLSLLTYRVLRKGDKGDDVLAMKRQLQELGYIRSGSELTNVYNDIMVERVILFQRQTGMTEDGISSQELQAFLFSDKAPVCSQTLPRVRTRAPAEGQNRIFCGCCMGEGCDCCGFTGWIFY